jgi:tetratricopeptide (TPR) repeat protein
MTQKDKTNHLTQKSKTIFLVLVLGLVLLKGSMADGKPWQGQKSPPCKTLRSMARVYMAYGDYAKAQPLAEEALALARTKNASDSELCLCLIDLAWLYRNQGKLADAEKICKLGLKLQEKVYYKNHPYVAYTLRILSSIYQGQSKYHQAKTALDRAMVIMQASHSPDDQVIAPFLVDTAELLVAQGDFEKAESYYQKAMVLIKNSYGPNHLYTANVLASMAELFALQGRYDKAEELIDCAVATQERIYGPDHHLIAPTWLTKAEVCYAKGNYTHAEQLIEKALSTVKKTGNMDKFTELERRAEEIRVGRHVASGGPIAKATR